VLIADPDGYVPRTLRSAVQAGERLPVAEAVRIVRELASGLSHLHGVGLVHRDIKPSNIVFVGGVAKLGDAGLVAHCREDMSVVGTDGYVPPEGMGKPQADLYSLGMVLYEIGTGRCRQDFPEVPSDLPSREDKPAFMRLNAVVLRACEHDPARRFKTASHLLDALARIQPEEDGGNENHTGPGKKPLLWMIVWTLVLLLLLIFSITILDKRSAAIWHERQWRKLLPAVAHRPSFEAEKESARGQGREPTEGQIPLPASESPGATPYGSNGHPQAPLPVRTVITESADGFLRP
jgi:serine/threonine protein kinase